MHDGSHLGYRKIDGKMQKVKVYGMYDLLEHNGETHTIIEWSSITMIDTNKIIYRLRKGMSVDKVLCKSLPKDSETVLEYKGIKKNISQWAKDKGMNVHTIAQRIRNGWTVEQALETPLVPPKERRADNKNNQ